MAFIDRELVDCLPEDAGEAMLVGRAWIPRAGPTVVIVRDGSVLDLSPLAPTVSQLLELESPAERLRDTYELPLVGKLSDFLASSHPDRRSPEVPHLLAPCDLQPIKACGVTFVASLIERVIEEQAQGDPGRTSAIREALTKEIGADLAQIRPGSGEAESAKRILAEKGLWSQYLEVGLGPDAEIFSKAPPLSPVGHGAEIGILPTSAWNNPEPEIVLAVNSRGDVVGATLGNDVNHRDLEGRSALLLGVAKDSNASCAIGPFIRLLDEQFRLDDVRSATVVLEVRGEDGFHESGGGSMRDISRNPVELVRQTMAHHQYPDGFLLFLGTMYVPAKDRAQTGLGFTHHVGDVVKIHSDRLGSLVNRVTSSERAPQWSFGIADLMRSLQRRSLL